jgi:RHS repeat-associated protein
MSYDGNNRLTSVNNTGTPGVPQMTLSYTYDARDNRTGLADNRNGSIAYTYDVANRMTRAELAANSLFAKARVDFGYDNANRMTSLARTNPLGGFGSGGGSVTVSSSLAYDDANRLTGLTHTAGYTTLASYTLTWDNANQLSQEISNDGTVNYGYDAAGQLTSASGWRTESYTYDGVGNRTMSGYQTGTGNRLLSDGSFNYTYDNEGNLLTKTEIATGKVTEYTWDYRNRLTNVKQKDSGGTVIQEQIYRYDPLDRRIGVGSDLDGAGLQQASWQYTVYDGINPYADFDNSGSLTNRYLYGPAVDQILARFSASGTIGWYLSDHLGSVRDIANQAGTVIDHIKYDSFGKIISESSPSNGDRFKFTGREHDPNTGQYYYRARYYDAAVGRFLKEDPIGFGGHDANLYRYVFNRPTLLTDPSGMEPTPDFTALALDPNYAAYMSWLAQSATAAGSSWVWPWDPNASWHPYDTISLWTGIPAAQLPYGIGVLGNANAEAGFFAGGALDVFAGAGLFTCFPV